jgi:hypothetical protein
MKKKLTKLMGVGLTIVLAASMLFGAAPVSAGTLSWGSESVPTTTGNVIVDGLDIADLAISADGTMYAVTDNDTYVYKSTNGGASWSQLSNVFDTNLGFVAVAPDDSGIVAVAENITDDNDILVSTNGGSTWGNLNHPQDSGVTSSNVSVIKDLTISNADGSKHYIGVAGIATATGNATTTAEVWYFDLGASAPVWNSTVQDGGFLDAYRQDTAFAVEFSPNVASDFVMVAVSANTGATGNVTVNMYSLNTKKWNSSAAFGSWPVNLQNSSTNIDSVSTAALVLSPDYLGSDDSLRTVFVGLGMGGSDAHSGVYRVKDTSTKDINDGSGKDIYSIDYDGTTLIAGNSENTKVYRSSDPLASSPSFSTTSELKRPGISSNVKTIVRWSGADVVAGVSGRGSAFAMSEDNGASFNDISFIDVGQATIGTPLDIDVAPDGSAVYALINDGHATSLYRNASSWVRVLAISDFSGSDGIVRLAPDDPDAIYVADEGATTIYYSAEGGDTKWFTRASKYSIVDLAVESADVAYVAVSGGKTVSKTTNGGFTWGSAKDTGIGGASIDMIRSLGEDNVLVAADGYVAWSTDGNSSWEKINTPLNTTGLTQATASGLSDGDYIYAATATAGSRVERWEIGQSGTSWKNLSASSSGNSCYGIAVVDGVLYAAFDDGTDQFTFRTLSPTSSEPSAGMWAILKSAGERFTAAPQSLKVSTGSTKLWQADTVTAAVSKPIFSYTDDIATVGPTLAAPGAGADVMMNPVSGGSYQITLSWERLSKATVYDYQVATDSGFIEKIVNTSTSSTTSSTPAISISAGTLNPGTTYYWRVRVNQSGPVRSAWSETRSFTVAALPEAQPPVIVQAPGPAPVIEVPPAPAITLEPPEIVLPAPPPAPPEIVIPAAPPAAAPPIPFWAILAIIIIGAVLVIALIVLIFRTRRPV